MKAVRLETFSDGVLAIIITIMVLELKVPEGGDWATLKKLTPSIISYSLSFIYIGIYWNNHHHLMHGTEKIDGGVMWANLHLLFWLSLIPFVTGWMGENHFTKTTVALYGVILFNSAVAYTILQWKIIRLNGKDSELAQALGKNIKGKISPFLYLLGVGLSFWRAWAAGIIYVIVALMWLIPERKIEESVNTDDFKNPNQKSF